jgi:tRNA nucleotidyltransferase/poly(A) polymerase
MVDSAIKFCSIMQAAGHEAVFAGGWVRDKIMGNPLSHDIDIATSATPDQVVAICKQNRIRTKEVGKSFGVVLVHIDNNEMEVATFRTEEGFTDGRHPDKVSFATMEEDAVRRDLTINAMFWNPITDTLFDFVGGRKDIQDHVIRFVGNAAERIKEDKLRMLRAVRFAAKFGFELDEDSFDAIQNHASEIKQISAERIQQELIKMFETRKFVACWNMMERTHLMHHILPEVVAMNGVAQGHQHHPEGNVDVHVKMVVSHLRGESWVLQLAGLLHDIAKPVTFTRDAKGIHFFAHESIGAEMSASIMKRLKFSTDQTDHVCNLVADHMKVHTAVDMKKSTLRKLMAQSHFEDLIKLGWADTASSKNDFTDLNRLLARVADLRTQEVMPKPMITGKHLIDLGMKPGPKFKELLTVCFDHQLEHGFEDEAHAMGFLKAML